MTTGLDPITRIESTSGSGVISVKSSPYNAIGDGTTDDTTAVGAALTDALAARSKLFFPAGRYLLTGSGTEILLVNKAIEICGEGMGASVIVVGSGVPSSCDVIRISPPASGIATYGLDTGRDNRGYYFHDFAIEAQSGTPARDAIRITTTTSGQYFHDSTFARLMLNDLGGKSIYHNNNNGGSAANTDGIFRHTVRECWLFDGIYGDFTGDSHHIINNTFRGFNKALEMNFVLGAGNLHFIGNNVTSDGGVQIHNSTGHTFLFNFIELYKTAAPGSNGAVLDITGDTGICNNVTIRYNLIGSLNANVLNGVRIANAVNTTVSHNYFNIPATTYSVVFPSSAARYTEYSHNAVDGGGGTYASPSLDTTLFIQAALWDALPAVNQAGGIGIAKIRSGQTSTSIVESGADVTVTLTDQLTTIPVFTGGAPRVVNLPQNTGGSEIAGRLLRILKIDSAANAVTITAFAGDTINGAATLVLPNQWDKVTIQASNVANKWYVVG